MTLKRFYVLCIWVSVVLGIAAIIGAYAVIWWYSDELLATVTLTGTIAFIFGMVASFLKDVV